MASLPAQGMKSFAFHCAGSNDESNQKVVAAWEAVRTNRPIQSETKSLEVGAVGSSGSFHLGDLPMRFVEDRLVSTNNCIDVVTDVESW